MSPREKQLRTCQVEEGLIGIRSLSVVIDNKMANMFFLREMQGVVQDWRMFKSRMQDRFARCYSFISTGADAMLRYRRK
jgi:hypothetical protein